MFEMDFESTKHLQNNIISVLFCLISVGYRLELCVAIIFNREGFIFYPNDISSSYAH